MKAKFLLACRFIIFAEITTILVPSKGVLNGILMIAIRQD